MKFQFLSLARWSRIALGPSVDLTDACVLQKSRGIAPRADTSRMTVSSVSPKWTGFTNYYFCKLPSIWCLQPYVLSFTWHYHVGGLALVSQPGRFFLSVVSSDVQPVDGQQAKDV